MTGRLVKILLSILCGAMLLLAGCTTPAPPTGGAAPTPATGGTTTGQAATSVTDLGSVTSLLQAMNDKLGLIAENTHPEGRDAVTGNIVLFDDMGNAANAIKTGTAILALPQGSCDIAIFAEMVPLYTTVEEEKDLSVNVDSRYYRNRQTCIDDPMCRETVSLDDEFSFLYIEYKPYKSGDSLNKVTLSYRC
jgi:hypothetical protein